MHCRKTKISCFALVLSGPKIQGALPLSPVCELREPGIELCRLECGRRSRVVRRLIPSTCRTAAADRRDSSTAGNLSTRHHRTSSSSLLVAALIPRRRRRLVAALHSQTPSDTPDIRPTTEAFNLYATFLLCQASPPRQRNNNLRIVHGNRRDTF